MVPAGQTLGLDLMPATPDPDLALQAAKTVADIYGQAVADLLKIVADRLARGIDQPGWAERKLAEVVQLRAEAALVVARLSAATPDAVAAAVDAGWSAGTRQGAAEVATSLAPVTNTLAVDALAAETIGAAQRVTGGMLRQVDDVWRQVIAETAAQSVTGARTRLSTAQQALNRFADRGLVTFRDTAGRRWAASTYVEMATRTAVGRAQVAGTLDRYQADGRDLVIVSDAPQECKLCRRWEGKVLSISGDTPKGTRVTGGNGARFSVAGSVADAQRAGLHHPNCFPGEVLAGGPPPEAGDRRWYEGDLVVIETASGVQLPVTPNHPVLTDTGWCPAGQLREGQHVLRHRGEVEPAMRRRPDDVQAPAPIGEVVGALRESVEMATVRVPASPEQFHGDGTIDGEVEVVGSHRLLEHDPMAALCDSCTERSFLGSGMGFGALLPAGALGEVGVGALHAPHGLVGGRHLDGASGGAHPGPLPGLGLAAGDASATDLDPTADGRLADAEGGRQLVLALAGSVSLDQIVHLGRRQFAGHVYNLQTRDGWYTAGSIVVHNCRHRLGAFVAGLTQRMIDTSDPRGDEARQEQRRLERGVRHWKQRAAASLDPDARKAAERHAREWQARLKSHVDTNDLKRLRQRERLGAR